MSRLDLSLKRPNLVPAPRLLPHLCRVDYGHSDLLPAYRVDLLPHDALDLVYSPLRQRQVAEDPRRQLADETGSQEQRVAGRLGVRWRPAERQPEHCAHAHERSLFTIPNLQELGSQVRRRAVVHETLRMGTAFFAEFHLEAIFTALKAELPEQIVYLAPCRAGDGDLHTRTAGRA